MIWTLAGIGVAFGVGYILGLATGFSRGKLEVLEGGSE